MDAVVLTLHDITSSVYQSVADLLTGDGDASEIMEDLDLAERAIVETRDYMSQIRTTRDAVAIQLLHANALHIIDHLTRLIRRGRMQDRRRDVASEPEMHQSAGRLAKVMTQPIESVESWTRINHELERLWKEIDQRMEPFRQRSIARSEPGKAGADRTIASLDAFRWLRRVFYHAWRIAFHLDPTTDQTAILGEHRTSLEHDPDAFSHDRLH